MFNQHWHLVPFIRSHISILICSRCWPELAVWHTSINDISTSVYLVFHVSQIKRSITSGVLVFASLPFDLELPRVLVAILQCRFISDGPGLVEQDLIKWYDWPEDMAT